MQIQSLVAFAALGVSVLAAPAPDSGVTPYNRALLISRELESIIPELQARDVSKRDCFDDCAEGCNNGLIAPCVAPGCDGFAIAGW